MSLKSFFAHVRNNRAMGRICFTMLLACMMISGLDSWRDGETVWVWIYGLLVLVYVPLTLLVWFLPDEDSDEDSV